MHIGGIESDQNRVEAESAHAFEQNGRIVMTGQAQETHPALRAGLQERFEGASFGEDAVEVVLSPQIVQLPEIEMIGVQSAQAVVEKAQGAVPRTVVSLGSKEDLAAALAKGSAVIIHAAGVGRGR